MTRFPCVRARAGLATFAVVCLLLHVVTRLGADAQVSHPFTGITFIDRVESVPRAIHARILQIDLQAPGLRFVLTPPGGSREVVRETTLGFLRATGAQIAVNAHFFLPFPSGDVDADAIGLAASEGRVFSGFESPAQNYALVADVPAINIDREDRASLVHRDPADSSGRRVREAVALWTVIGGSAQIVTDGVVTIPAYRDAEHPDGVLTPGGPNAYSNEKSWYDAVNARTAIGLSRDRQTLTLCVVDARGGSAGMTVRELAAWLVGDYGVWQALNLDGGGSSSLAMVDPTTNVATLINASSDNPAGRAVATNLAVFASPR